MSNYCGFKGIAILTADGFEQLIKMQGNEISDGFSTFEHLLGMSNHAFDDEFEISKTQPYLLINQEEKAVRFCTTFGVRHSKQFLSDLRQCATALVMKSIAEAAYCSVGDLEWLYVRQAALLHEIFPNETQQLTQGEEVEDGVFALKETASRFGCGGEVFWEKVEDF